jgi:uroporphyrinogen decarboxylase
LISRVEDLPIPDPDIAHLLAVLRREKPDRIPMLELKIDEEVMSALLGEPFIPWSKNAPADARRKSIDQTVSLMYRLGFDGFRLRTAIPFTLHRDKTADTADLSRGQRQWQSEHEGPIQTMQDLERYRWPTLAEVDFGPAEEVLKALPDGMGCIGYCSGVFEWSSWLMGLEAFSVALYDSPELVREVVDRAGRLVYECLEVWCRTAEVPIIWLGDDLGFKTATMISPQHLREYILPWHRRYVELAHRHDKSFILHCCGNIAAVMPDYADTVGIDAKHSFEDIIEPVEDFHGRWGHRMAAVGGVDVDILSRMSEVDVVRRTRQILETCAPRGGYAAGSGNSVANYVPVDNYLAMIETIHRFNGRL